MNYDKFYDLAQAARYGETTKIGGVTLGPKEINEAFTRTVQAFMHAPSKKKGEYKIQAFGSTADLSDVDTDVFNNTTEIENFDLNWSDVFRSIQLNKGQLQWEIHTSALGTAFKEIPEGGKIVYEGMQSSKETVNVKKYGMGLGITWETIEGRKVYKFIQDMEDARSKLYNIWADIHYGLLDTAGATNTVAYQGSASDSTIDRDIQTLNETAYQLTNAVKDSGYGDTANARLVFFCNPKYKSRVKRALRLTDSDAARLGGKGQVVDYAIEPRFTYNGEITSAKGLMVLPGKKIQNAIYLREKQLDKVEQESLNMLKTYWTAFGAAIGDNDQVYQMSFA